MYCSPAILQSHMLRLEPRSEKKPLLYSSGKGVIMKAHLLRHVQSGAIPDTFSGGLTASVQACPCSAASFERRGRTFKVNGELQQGSMLRGIRSNVLFPTNRTGGGSATLYLAVIQGRNLDLHPVLAARKKQAVGMFAMC